MLKFHFHKYKYGKELLVDCLKLSEIAGRSLALKELHATTFYEIYFFLKGNGSILFEGSQLDFKSPSVLFLPPSRPRQWKVPATPDCRMVIFEGEFMETFLKDHLFLHRLYYFGNADSLPILPLQSKDVSLFQHLTDSIKGEISRQSFDSQHLLRAYLYQLLILLNRHYADYYALKGNLYQNTDMLQFRDLLKKHIREKQTVKEYAALLGINRNRLSQLCQEAFGKDANTIIRNELLQSCKDALLASNKTIAEISYEHNFSAPSNFVRFFKSLAKISPAAYRSAYAD
ncbi:AraC family transcriptional regulator [Chitinophaga polysaccharea]|uniref:AraC family transcriptional regulator n=1 Tax=Chitinophaga polysaccharea TaxID=1293035 RepID=UPI001455268B|nr:AraC family transcriptional regulator [Chitinophaga polysaccharea]NLR59265.1 AraC family transcriptional regulator [Chitinophaga polysaccharea]